jgi:chromosomal replication initiation ATPase DnaA
MLLILIYWTLISIDKNLIRLTAMRDNQKIKIFQPLKPEKTFARFVSDKNNQGAYELCKSVAGNPGKMLSIRHKIIF